MKVLTLHYISMPSAVSHQMSSIANYCCSGSGPKRPTRPEAFVFQLLGMYFQTATPRNPRQYSDLVWHSPDGQIAHHRTPEYGSQTGSILELELSIVVFEIRFPWLILCSLFLNQLLKSLYRASLGPPSERLGNVGETARQL